MQIEFWQDVYSAMVNDVGLKALFPQQIVSARFKEADDNQKFPYIVYNGKDHYDTHESFALGTSYVTFDVWDFKISQDRNLAIVEALKALFNRTLFERAGSYRATRFYIRSTYDLVPTRPDLQAQQIVFKVRYYDERLATQRLGTD
jgi:hypothetical protein